MSPGTPQQNGKVERKVATLFGYARSMMNDGKFSNKMRKGLWLEAAATATTTHNLLIMEEGKHSPYFKFYGKESKHINHLRQFGEIAIVKIRKKQSKIENWGQVCVMVGYCDEHSKDTYRLFDIKMKKVIISRNVQWLSKSYGKWVTDQDNESDESDDDWNEIDELNNDDFGETEQQADEILSEETEKEDTNELEINPRKKSETRKLQTFFNPPDEVDTSAKMTTRSGRMIEGRAETAFIHWDIQRFVMESATVGKETNEPKQMVPTRFNDAWNHPNMRERDKWRKVIKKEINNMIKLNVWIKVNQNQIPEDKRCVKFKWVFNIKQDGTFWARLVACGYSQIPGIDFNESYSPVISDIGYRILILVRLMNNYKVFLIDVETAFLHGDLDEEIFMECPDGLPHKDDKVVLLKKLLYGLVQAARQFHKKWTEVLSKLGYTQSKTEPSFYLGKNGLFIGTYVDDNLVIRSQENVDKFVQKIEGEGLKVTVNKGISDYLSCEVILDYENKRG